MLSWSIGGVCVEDEYFHFFRLEDAFVDVVDGMTASEYVSCVFGFVKDGFNFCVVHAEKLVSILTFLYLSISTIPGML